jgi:hypothetical protein
MLDGGVRTCRCQVEMKLSRLYIFLRIRTHRCSKGGSFESGKQDGQEFINTHRQRLPMPLMRARKHEQVQEPHAATATQPHSHTATQPHSHTDTHRNTRCRTHPLSHLPVARSCGGSMPRRASPRACYLRAAASRTSMHSGSPVLCKGLSWQRGLVLGRHSLFFKQTQALTCTQAHMLVHTRLSPFIQAPF